MESPSYSHNFSQLKLKLETGPRRDLNRKSRLSRLRISRDLEKFSRSRFSYDTPSSVSILNLSFFLSLQVGVHLEGVVSLAFTLIKNFF